MKQENIAAYAAGIFDGEGYVGIDRVSKSKGSKKIHHSIRIVISQKDGAIMDWLKNNFGGNIYSQRNGTLYSIYRWRIHSKKAADFLKFVYPYLIIKKRQAKLAIWFMKQRDKRRKPVKVGKDGRFTLLSEKELLWRIEIKHKLEALKKDYKVSTMIGSQDFLKK